MKKIAFAILGMAFVLASCVGQKGRKTVVEPIYRYPDSEELGAQIVERHNGW